MARASLLLLGLPAALAGCAHVEAAPPAPPAPAAEAPAPSPAAPETTLRIKSVPLEALRSAHFAALEITFENPSNEWHRVQRVSIAPERQIFGPALESVLGERLRAWQLAARETQHGKDGPPHPALETLAPDVPEKSDAAAPGVPPEHLLAGPFTVAPGLFARKWVVLYSAAEDALLGQDLVVAYELEDGHVERALVQYPNPRAKN